MEAGAQPAGPCSESGASGGAVTGRGGGGRGEKRKEAPGARYGKAQAWDLAEAGNEHTAAIGAFESVECAAVAVTLMGTKRRESGRRSVETVLGREGGDAGVVVVGLVVCVCVGGISVCRCADWTS